MATEDGVNAKILALAGAIASMSTDRVELAKDRVLFEQRLASFMAAAQTVIDIHMENSFPNAHYVVKLSVEGGTKYLKIVRREFMKADGQPYGQGASVHCFVSTVDGSVLKAATWKAPAKHARGNIFADDFGAGCMNPYGAAYLR